MCCWVHGLSIATRATCNTQEHNWKALPSSLLQRRLPKTTHSANKVNLLHRGGCCSESICAFADLGLKYTMLSKHSLPYDPQQVPDAKRFRHNASDLFLTNTVSAKRAASLFADAELAGTEHVADLGKIGARAGSRNNHRDLLRRLVKKSKWPKLYFAPVRVWNRRTQAEEIQQVPALLPHEVFADIAGQSDIDSPLGRT